MAIIFPTSPRIRDKYTINNITYVYDGTGWDPNYWNVVTNSLDFPALPSINDTYQKANITFTWNGDYWDSLVTSAYPEITRTALVDSFYGPSGVDSGLRINDNFLIDDNKILLSEAAYDGTFTAEGRLTLRDLGTNDLLYTFINPSPQASGYFGTYFVNDTYIIVKGNDSTYFYNRSDYLLHHTIAGGSGAYQASNDNILINLGTTIPNYTFELRDIETGTLINTITNPNEYTGIEGQADRFGWTSAMDDTIIAIAAAGENESPSVTESGKVYIYSSVTGNYLYTIDNPNDYGTAHEDWFGYTDIELTDSHIIIAAESEDEAPGVDPDYGFSVGVVYFFNKTTGVLEHTLRNPNHYYTTWADRFGYKVKVRGDILAVSSINEDSATDTNSGVVYLFKYSTFGLITTVVNPDIHDGLNGGSPADYFGSQIALVDGYLFATAPSETNDAETDEGVLYKFSLE